MTDSPLVTVNNLTKRFPGQTRPAVEDVSFAINAGETLGLVGESGSGKTTAGRCVLRLIEPTGGTISIAGDDVRAAGRDALRRLRRHAQMVFQDPSESLTPWMRVGAIVREGLEVHQIAEGSDADRRVERVLEEVGLRAGDAARYPDELSGGQRQRVGIARALALEPRFIVCDEALSSLDVSIQAQVLNLLLDLQRDRRLTYLFIAHNLAIVERIATHIAVMHNGRIVEMGAAASLLAAPRDPRTQSLLAAMPVLRNARPSRV